MDLFLRKNWYKNYLIVDFHTLKRDIKMDTVVKQWRIQERGIAGNREYLL